MEVKSYNNKQHFGMAAKSVRLFNKKPLVTFVYGNTNIRENPIPESKYLIFAKNSHTTAGGKLFKIESDRIIILKNAVLEKIDLIANKITLGDNAKTDENSFNIASKRIKIKRGVETGYNDSSGNISIQKGSKTQNNTTWCGKITINGAITGENKAEKVIIKNGLTGDNHADNKIIIKGKSKTEINTAPKIKMSKESSAKENIIIEKKDDDYLNRYDSSTEDSNDDDFIPFIPTCPIIL